ncbi:unnamed protein product [Paramecium pentaurelia]|uniref:Uncharacterized protein n=1 Tax=Paramecium pentaurelia TaxID=43138 RepID=A0A8S1Y8D7_9CILI|nr:unnamed protein product [Paramecium pentaurelia]
MFIIQRIINKEFIFNKVKKDLIIQFIYYLKARDPYLVTKIDQTLVEHEKALAIDPQIKFCKEFSKLENASWEIVQKL